MKNVNYIPLNSEEHQHLKVLPQAGWPHVANEYLLPVTIAELSHLCNIYPLMLVKDTESGQFHSVAVTHFFPGGNLYLQDSSWQEGYVPMKVKVHPFASQPQSDGRNATVLIDTNSPYLNDTEGESLFDTEGKKTDYLHTIEALAQDLNRYDGITYHFIEKLKELNLIAEVRVDLQYSDNKKYSLNGIYTIDPQRLKSRSDEEIVTLHKLNYLQSIYSMINSVGQFQMLKARFNQKEERNINNVTLTFI